MQALRSTKELQPLYYKGNDDFNAVTDEYDALFAEQSTNLQRIWYNTFILLADSAGLTAFENILGIRATATESLEFRRERILNRYALTPPFTKRFLEERLDAIIGADQYTLNVDYQNQTVTVETINSNIDWYQEIQITFIKFLPANMIYVNIPKVIQAIQISEEIRYGPSDEASLNSHYNYKLGSWALGQLPFGTDLHEEVAKLPSTPSIQPAMLNHNATFTASDIAKIRLNGTFTISEFVIKQAVGNEATLQYNIPQEVAGSSITQIELLDSNDVVLSNSACFIPNTTALSAKHIIRFQEGYNGSN